MAIISGYFNAVETEPGVFDREYEASDFAEFISALVDTGVLNEAGEEFEVAADGTSLSTNIGTGLAFIEGYYARNKEAITHNHDAEQVGMNRIDRVVLRLNLNLEYRLIDAYVVKGVPASNPVPPELTRNENIYEISLAQVLVRGGQNYISPNDVTDERGDEELCPWATSKIIPPITVPLQALIDDLEAFKPTVVPLTQKGVPNGVATLGADGKVPLEQVPTSKMVASSRELTRPLPQLSRSYDTDPNSPNNGVGNWFVTMNKNMVKSKGMRKLNIVTNQPTFTSHSTGSGGYGSGSGAGTRVYINGTLRLDVPTSTSDADYDISNITDNSTLTIRVECRMPSDVDPSLKYAYQRITTTTNWIYDVM